jgi:hypothetical protein
MGAAKKGRWGGPRRGSGRPPQIEGEPRRNRVVVLVTDYELTRLESLAERDGSPVGTKAWQLLSRALRRAK